MTVILEYQDLASKVATLVICMVITELELTQQ